MAKIKLRELEINITKGEAEQVNQALLAGVEFIKIGDQLINSKYIIGVFSSQEPEPQYDRLISAPKPKEKDFKKIEELLEEMKGTLKQKGIMK